MAQDLNSTPPWDWVQGSGLRWLRGSWRSELPGIVDPATPPVQDFLCLFSEMEMPRARKLCWISREGINLTWEEGQEDLSPGQNNLDWGCLTRRGHAETQGEVAGGLWEGALTHTGSEGGDWFCERDLHLLNE